MFTENQIVELTRDWLAHNGHTIVIFHLNNEQGHDIHEPPRLSRRLHSLRGRSNGKAKSIFS
jgi:hypothetical protein